MTVETERVVDWYVLVSHMLSCELPPVTHGHECGLLLGFMLSLMTAYSRWVVGGGR